MYGACSPTVSISSAWDTGDRPRMEDRCSIGVGRMPDGGLDYVLLSLFDGHGGTEAAEAAASILPQQVDVTLKELSTTASAESLALRMAFHRTNELLFEQMREWRSSAGDMSSPSVAGTTTSAVLIRGRRLVVANCGDSSTIVGVRTGDVDGAGPSCSNWYPVGIRASATHSVSDEELKRIVREGGQVSISPRPSSSRVIHSFCSSHCWSRRLSCSHPKTHRPLLNMTRSLGDFWSFSSRTGRCVVSCDPHIVSFDIKDESIFGLCIHSDGIDLSPSDVANTLFQSADDNDKENRQLYSGDFVGGDALSKLKDCLASQVIRGSRRGRRPSNGWDNATAVTALFSLENNFVTTSFTADTVPELTNGGTFVL